MNIGTDSALVTTTPLTVLVLLKRVDCVDGVAAYLENLATGLHNRGDSVVLVTGPVSTPDGSHTRRDAIRANVAHWVVINDFQTRWPRLSQLRQVLRLIKHNKVDVIAPQGFTVLPFASVIARLSSLPVVLNYHPTAHGNVASEIASLRSRKTRLAYRTVCQLFGANSYIAPSREIETFYRKDCGIQPADIHYQPFGVDDSIYCPPSAAERADARAAYGISDDTLSVVLSGRLNLVKGHDIAVDALRQLRASHPKLKTACLFAGSGNQREEIEQYTFRDDADRQTFRFLGFINNAHAIRQLYWATDILILPSRFEGFGIVVAEAMFCGAVPIRTPSGGWQDQIEDGFNGFIIPFNDPDALANRIVQLSDATKLAAMRQRSIKAAQTNFTQRAMIEGTSALFRNVTATKRSLSPVRGRSHRAAAHSDVGS